MSDEKALLQHLACVVPESSWFFRGHLQHVAEYLYRAGLALVPAADVERLAALEAQSKLYAQECGMCGSTAEELVEYQQWLERGKPTDAVTPEERAVLEASRDLAITSSRGQNCAYVAPQDVAGLGRLLHAELARRRAAKEVTGV